MPGGSVNITCVAVGSPMPYVKWMLGTEDLTPEDEMPIGRNVLELNGVRESANYTCVAMSSLGIIEAIAQVLVKSKSCSNCRINHRECQREGDQWLERSLGCGIIIRWIRFQPVLEERQSLPVVSTSLSTNSL